jgi:hypothetical protein
MQLFDEEATRNLSEYAMLNGIDEDTAVRHQMIRELLMETPERIPPPKVMAERLAQRGVQATERQVRDFYEWLGWKNPDEKKPDGK